MPKIDIPAYVSDILIYIEKSGFEAYLVGGCVRDSILGMNVCDYDLATNASIEELLVLFNGYNIINKNGFKHNTITVRHDNNNIEISSYKHNNDEDNSIEVDLAHRDLTINAMAYNLNGKFIDPYNGLESINKRILCTPLDSYTIIKEDYLRILRVLRFSSILDFDIDINLKNAILDLCFNLDKVSKERIKKELNGILIGKRVRDILIEFKEVITTIIPELKPCVGFNQNNKYHIHDVYEHIAYTVGYSKAICNVRLSALLHDIGKPKCYSEEIKNGIVCGHFYNHPIVGADMALDILKRLTYSKKDIEEIYFLIKYHDNTIAYTEKSVKKLLIKTPNNDIDIFKNLLELKLADRLDHVNTEDININKYIDIINDIISKNECLSIKDLDINGNDLIELGFKGIRIKEVLNDVFDKVYNNNLENDKKKIICYIKDNYFMK